MNVFGDTYSDIGTVRTVNQDRISLDVCSQSGDIMVFGLICDGIGGMDHGEIAADLVCESLRSWFRTIVQWINVSRAEPELIVNHLRDAVDDSNYEVWKLRQQRVDTGSTLSCILIIRGSYYILQVGDSRVYNYDPDAAEGSRLVQLTSDAVVTKIKEGKPRTLLDNYMGKKEDTWYTQVTGDLQGNSMFLFSSDGFYHRLTENDADQIYRDCTSQPEKTPEILKNAVFRMEERGDKDNISAGVIVVENQNSTASI